MVGGSASAIFMWVGVGIFFRKGEGVWSLYAHPRVSPSNIVGLIVAKSKDFFCGSSAGGL